jgi:predicted DNA binding protein
MTLFEVVFKVMFDDLYSNISRRFPSAKMFFWCNGEYDVIEVIVENPEEYPLIVEKIPKPRGFVEESSDYQRSHLITKRCSCCVEDNSVVKYIGELDILHISPAMLERGWEYHRIIAFRHADLKELLQRLEEKGFAVDILRKVPFDGFIGSSLALTGDSLFADLTEKQIIALLTAYRNGYYRLPRRADVQTIAAKEGLSRTTFQEHLKKAENKLVATLVPYIQLYKHASAEKRRSLS